MRIVIGGASGLIGTALVQELRAQDHHVRKLARRASSDGDISWDPDTGKLDAAQLNGIDALIHLSGESVASGRWTAAKKKAIRESRVKSTQLLAKALTSTENPPKTWLCASAVGWYGDRGNTWLDEDTAAGEGFLASVCKEWEAATRPAADAGIRVVNMRFSVVLSADGGAFKTMMTAFKLGAGGIIGSGEQYVSWITVDDAVRAIMYALANPYISGPMNVATPNPVTNRELTKSLGAALHRPTILPMPAFLARAAFGEMADEMFLASTRVRPKKLADAGFAFESPILYEALHKILG
ncbi:MAG: TIGR01777 family protein [Candidatus Hydrogenedentes bacterium]|nr:TIGR01777 family protein [Candidatus Hydrogenedentota bacterium]